LAFINPSITPKRIPLEKAAIIYLTIFILPDGILGVLK
jgi:hypothetical protein